MTQREKILNMLADGGWHCTSQMYASFMADPRTILAKLRKENKVEEPRWCQSHKHEGNMKEWKIKLDTCCVSWRVFGTHGSECPKRLETKQPDVKKEAVLF